MTKNGEVNFVLAQRAAEEFDPPRVLAVFPKNPDSQSSSSKVRPALTFNLPLENWNQYLDDGQVKLVETVLQDPGFAFQQTYLSRHRHTVAMAGKPDADQGHELGKAL